MVVGPSRIEAREPATRLRFHDCRRDRQEFFSRRKLCLAPPLASDIRDSSGQDRGFNFRHVCLRPPIRCVGKAGGARPSRTTATIASTQRIKAIWEVVQISRRFCQQVLVALDEALGIGVVYVDSHGNRNAPADVAQQQGFRSGRHTAWPAVGV